MKNIGKINEWEKIPKTENHPQNHITQDQVEKLLSRHEYEDNNPSVNSALRNVQRNKRVYTYYLVLRAKKNYKSMFMFYRKWRNEICYGFIACASKESFQDDLRILLKLLEEDKLSRPGEVHLFNDLFPRFLRQRFDVVKFCQKELERISGFYPNINEFLLPDPEESETP